MLNRRLVLGAGLVGATSPLLLHSVPASAAKFAALNTPLNGTVFYTSEKPGRWKGKEAGHAPIVDRSTNNIEVTTAHPMDGYVHYIVKHQILDSDFNFVEEILFDPEKDSPTTTHSIKNLSGAVYAVSMCNKHDVWVTGFKI